MIATVSQLETGKATLKTEYVRTFKEKAEFKRFHKEDSGLEGQKEKMTYFFPSKLLCVSFFIFPSNLDSQYQNKAEKYTLDI